MAEWKRERVFTRGPRPKIQYAGSEYYPRNFKEIVGRSWIKQASPDYRSHLSGVIAFAEMIFNWSNELTLEFNPI